MTTAAQWPHGYWGAAEAFRCSMDSEYATLTERFGFTAEELVRLGANAARARFQPQLGVQGARVL